MAIDTVIHWKIQCFIGLSSNFILFQNHEPLDLGYTIFRQTRATTIQALAALLPAGTAAHQAVMVTWGHGIFGMVKLLS